jgi:hypothetical protein
MNIKIILFLILFLFLIKKSKKNDNKDIKEPFEKVIHESIFEEAQKVRNELNEGKKNYKELRDYHCNNDKSININIRTKYPIRVMKMKNISQRTDEEAILFSEAGVFKPKKNMIITEKGTFAKNYGLCSNYYGKCEKRCKNLKKIIKLKKCLKFCKKTEDDYIYKRCKDESENIWCEKDWEKKLNKIN